jgi:recombination protein RecR
MNYPKEFENLIDSFRRLPGIGYKSAERMAYQVLEMKDEYRERFIESLQGVSSLKKCKICHNLSSSNQCEICADINRDKSIICVVQSIKDVFAIEKSNSYNGLYHVLDGVISVKSGKLPEDLNIDSLIERIKTNEVEEIIIATNATLEGETTARYLKELIKDYNVKITRIAHGLPVGGDLSYADEMTVLKALEGRREY